MTAPWRTETALGFLLSPYGRIPVLDAPAQVLGGSRGHRAQCWGPAPVPGALSAARERAARVERRQHLTTAFGVGVSGGEDEVGPRWRGGGIFRGEDPTTPQHAASVCPS